MKNLLVTLFVTIISVTSYAQTNKIPLTHDVYDRWNDLMNPLISANGKWVSYEINPQDGNGNLWLVDSQSDFKASFSRGNKASFSPLNDFIVYQVKPEKAVVRKAKLAKKKKDDMPKDSLKVYVFESKKTYSFPKLKSYKTGEIGGNWIAILTEMKKKDKQPADSSQIEKPKAKKKKTKINEEDKPGLLTLLNPLKDISKEFSGVLDYSISRNGSLIAFNTKTDDTLSIVSVQIFDEIKNESFKIFEQKGDIKNLAIDEAGTQLVFQFSADTGKVKNYDLFYWPSKDRKAEMLISAQTSGMPLGWVVSQHTAPYFSRSGNRLILSTLPKQLNEPKDTLTDDEKVVMDLWSWTDTLLQTQQKFNLKDELKRSYLAYFNLKDKKLYQLADKQIPEVRLEAKIDAPLAIGSTDLPYRYAMTYESPINSDYYLYDLKTGAKKLALKGNPFRVSLSPSGNYLAYYQPSDNAWYMYIVKENRSICLTAGMNVNFFEEDNDTPSIPRPYGFAGWVEGDKFFVVYDEYDIWGLDPTGKSKPINLTGGKGRASKMVLRYQKTDPESVYIKANADELLSMFNQINKQSGYYSINFCGTGSLKKLISGDYRYSNLKKSRNSDRLIWQKESYKEYRDLWVSNITFADSKQISLANPQMSKYQWGSIELVKWVDFNRDSVEGLLYKPENFDPSKKYPMMVYFYEKESADLNLHYEPKPGRSVICPTLYASDGYLVFMPDIKYRIGTPGRSAYDAIISGTMAMVNRGFVDKDRIGVQGQSWGGYQIAYLVTQTDLFKAASAGAPVSNMTSAYGGIRWESGMARMFQYEHEQSRIGGTLWEKPLNYIENSPLFYAPRVNTPLLIRHDDADGAVPWYQGIEYFLALRRLGKPVWMVNYNDEPHNLVRRANRIDWTIRMKQFFDYYLKDAPQPEWLKQGIPAIRKGKTLGY
ncbi:MAG: S9 family peptidase [Bacteroidales bacterium]|nr:S9 family peptidase [Bacteroidales bacterium]